MENAHPFEDQVFATAYKEDLPRVLVVLPFSPNAIRGRTLEMLKVLIGRAMVDVVCLNDGAPVELPQGICRSVVVPSASKLMRAARILLGLVRGFPICHEFYNSFRLPGVLKRLGLDNYDAVVVHRLPLHRLLEHPNVIYDCNDCCSYQSRLFAREAKSFKRFLYAVDAVLAPRHEVAACNSANVVLVTAEREAGRLRELGVTRPIEVWIHDRRVEQPPRVLRERARLVLSFHGKLTYEPNTVALRTLNDVIWPALDPSRYDLRVIGKCPSSFSRSFPNLKFTGYVESIPDAVRESDLCILPLTMSVGFPNKAMESIAVGVPIIVTPGIAEGLPPMSELLERGVYVRKVDEFPAEIERFRCLTLQDRQDIAEHCYRYVQRLYSSTALDEQWNRLLGLRKARHSEGIIPAFSASACS